MNVFIWLVLGHILGDWVFQNDWMARGKKQGLVTAAGMVHFLTYTAVVTGVLWLSGSVSEPPLFYLTVGFIIFVTHWLVDATNLVDGWMRFYRQSQIDMVRVMVDQSFHILVLVLVTIFFLQN